MKSFLIGILIGIPFVFLASQTQLRTQATEMAQIDIKSYIVEENTTVEEIEQIKAYDEPYQVEMTFYTHTSQPCANGKMPRKGIVAYASEYIGWSVVIYNLDYELIGIYEVYDTGFGRGTGKFDNAGNEWGTIELGQTIDVFFDNESDGWEFLEEHGNQVLIQLVNAKG